MARNYFQDIKPPRANQDVRPKQDDPTQFSKKVDFYDDSHLYNELPGGGGRPRMALWGIALASVVGLGIAIAYIFSGATVTVTPVAETEVLEADVFTAQKDGTENATLPYQLMILKDEVTQKVPSTGEKDVEEKASGHVTLYNTFSSAPQLLKEDTRLIATNGKIYKIIGPSTIPGTSTKEGAQVPGEVTVPVYAENPGPEYNIASPTDFKIFGFKGTPKYDKFSGKSTEPISGGFRGKKAVPDQTALDTALVALKTTLAERLSTQAKAQIPAGFVFYDGGSITSYDQVAIGVADTSGSVPISQKGVYYGFIFNKEKLQKVIAKKIIADYDNTPIEIRDIETLVLALKDKEKIAPADVKEIEFTLSGSATVVWKVDDTKVIQALVGKPRNQFMQIISGFPTILSAEIKVFPVWSRTIPNDKEKIEIVIKNTSK
jgi:hypothetical protein